jgi:S1-C subfamily serine protease
VRMRSLLPIIVFVVTGIMVSGFAVANENDWGACALRLTVDDGQATGTFISLGIPPQYFILTAYHAIFERSDIEVASEYGHYDISELIESHAPYFADPAMDLAVFRVSPAGVRHLQNDLRRTAFPLADVCAKGALARVTGNPKIVIGESVSTPINDLSLAGVKNCMILNNFLDNSYAEGDARWTTLLVLESLKVSPGYSGGPVVVKGKSGKEADRVVAGIIQGGAAGEFISWAISAPEIVPKINKALSGGKFSEFPPPQWPAQLFKITRS